MSVAQYSPRSFELENSVKPNLRYIVRQGHFSQTETGVYNRKDWSEEQEFELSDILSAQNDFYSVTHHRGCRGMVPANFAELLLVQGDNKMIISILDRYKYCDEEGRENAQSKSQENINHEYVCSTGAWVVTTYHHQTAERKIVGIANTHEGVKKLWDKVVEERRDLLLTISSEYYPFTD